MAARGPLGNRREQEGTQPGHPGCRGRTITAPGSAPSCPEEPVWLSTHSQALSPCPPHARGLIPPNVHGGQRCPGDVRQLGVGHRCSLGTSPRGPCGKGSSWVPAPSCPSSASSLSNCWCGTAQRSHVPGAPRPGTRVRTRARSHQCRHWHAHSRLAVSSHMGAWPSVRACPLPALTQALASALHMTWGFGGSRSLQAKPGGYRNHCRAC